MQRGYSVFRQVGGSYVRSDRAIRTRYANHLRVEVATIKADDADAPILASRAGERQQGFHVCAGRCSVIRPYEHRQWEIVFLQVAERRGKEAQRFCAEESGLAAQGHNGTVQNRLKPCPKRLSGVAAPRVEVTQDQSSIRELGITEAVSEVAVRPRKGVATILG